MADFTTNYMGIPLRSPLVVAASPISNMIDRIEKAEASGAGALVIRSLFEEQTFQESSGAAEGSAVRTYFPSLEHTSVKDHLAWVEKTRKTVNMPLIASLNALHHDVWTGYAESLESTGVDALELNFYRVEADLQRGGESIEQGLYRIVEDVTNAVNIPVAVKISPFYTSIANVAAQLDQRGVRGLVLFNRFVQPDIDLNSLSLHNEMPLSHPDEIKLPLRWTAILYGRVAADIALTTGVHTGEDAIKSILAGAQVVQVAATLLRHGIGYLETMQHDMERWLHDKGYDNLDEIRGKLSQKNCPDPQLFERAQYVRLMLAQH